MKHRSEELILVAALVAVLPGAASPQTLRNGDFELRDPVQRETPAGWQVRGDGYEIALDSVVTHGAGLSLRISHIAGESFANANQTLDAEAYHGQRVVLSGYIRSRDVERGYAGLWMRFDTGDGEVRFIDNMAGRGATGTTEWTRFEVVGFIEEDVASIIFGPLLPGSGSAWFDDLVLEGTPMAELPLLSEDAGAYLDRALNLVRDNALRSDSVDWATVRRGALARAAGAQTPRDTYGAIRYALAALGDGHSFLREPILPSDTVGRRAAEEARNYGILSALFDPGIGYILVPSFTTGAPDVQQGFAEEIQRRIRTLDEAAPCGWIVDLRRNGGGNMWPMLAGLGPILGEGEAGAFIGVGGRRTVWGYDEGQAWSAASTIVSIEEPHRLQIAGSPVAVLTGRITASSGEAIVVAFRGRPNTRSFGADTRGLSTANAGNTLSDGATILLTVSVFADRTGQTYGSAIAPDDVVSESNVGVTPGPDAVIRRASEWLMELPACRG